MGGNVASRSRPRAWRKAFIGAVSVVACASLIAVVADVFGAGAAALGWRGSSHANTQAEVAARIRVAPGARVELWGDSLAWESAVPFVARLHGRSGALLDVTTHTFGGTATCDWLADIHARASDERIAVAMLEFSGNALTPCMTGDDGAPLQGAAYLDAYRRPTLDAIAALQRAGARVYLVGAPVARRASAEGAALRRLYEQIAAERPGVEFVDAGQSVLDRGRWTNTLPCLPHETAVQGCVDGRIVVRAPDGGHFCPGVGPAVRGVVGPCPRWSSGAVRFGRAMADAIVAAFEPAVSAAGARPPTR